MRHTDSSPSSLGGGVFFAVLAYGSWGLLPIYWKLFGQVPAIEVLSHRMIWSLVLLSSLVFLQKRGAELLALRQTPKFVAMLGLTALLLTLNWGLFIYGINSDRVVETSLGYFINPLVNVLLGCVFLKERLTRWQAIAVGLATLGVTNFIGNIGTVPWIALGLAFTFGFYGLLRKIVPVTPMVGLTVETSIITPIALMFVIYWAIATPGNFGNFGSSFLLTLLFIGAGIITSMPLLWFNNAAKRLKLATLGFFQYLAPSLQLLLGVALYREPFTPTHAVTFGFIWTALVIYSTTTWRSRHSKN